MRDTQEAMEAVRAHAQGRADKAAREKEDMINTHAQELRSASAEAEKRLAEEKAAKEDLAAKLERAAGCLKAAEELKEAR